MHGVSGSDAMHVRKILRHVRKTLRPECVVSGKHNSSIKCRISHTVTIQSATCMFLAHTSVVQMPGLFSCVLGRQLIDMISVEALAVVVMTPLDWVSKNVTGNFNCYATHHNSCKCLYLILLTQIDF